MVGRRFHHILVLTVAALLALSVSQGYGRQMMETAAYRGSSVQSEDAMGKSRMTIQVMDYADPEPNVNPRTGILLSPPPPSQV